MPANVGALAFGQLEVNADCLNTHVHIWNYASGYKIEFCLNVEQFGYYLEFGHTLEQVLFLFEQQNGCKVVGFDSSTKTLFECIQNNDSWTKVHLSTINVNVTQIERKTPGSWISNNDDSIKETNEEKRFFLASNLFKVYLIQNDFSTKRSTVQRILESKNLSVTTPIHQVTQTIKKVAGGNDFVLLLTHAGHVFSFGTGSRGELGISPMEAESNEPRPIEDLIDADIQIVDIACGGWHSVALTSENDVYCWGLNTNGQCGVPADEMHILEIPHPINLAQAALSIQAGMKTTLVRLEDDSTVLYGKT